MSEKSFKYTGVLRIKNGEVWSVERKPKEEEPYCPNTMFRYDNTPNEYKTVWACRICTTVLLSENAVRNHEILCNEKLIEPEINDVGSSFYTCECCDKIFTHEQALRKHKHKIALKLLSEKRQLKKSRDKSSSSVSRTPPSTSNTSYTGVLRIKNGEVWSVERKPKKEEPYCPNTMFRYDNTPNEYKTVWTCRICTTVLLSENAVQNHEIWCKEKLNEHSPEINDVGSSFYTCECCDKTFTHELALRKHKNTIALKLLSEKRQLKKSRDASFYK